MYTNLPRSHRTEDEYNKLLQVLKEEGLSFEEKNSYFLKKWLTVIWLSCQDPIHAVKKLLGSIDLVRNIYCGEHTLDLNLLRQSLKVDWSDFEQVYTSYVDFRSLKRKDPMDFPSVQKLIQLKVYTALKANHVSSDLYALGVYIQLIFRFRMVFLGINVPMVERIKWIGFIKNFLYGWHASFEVKRSGGKCFTVGKVKENFITLEAFRDCVLACDFFISILRLNRDLTPDTTIDFLKCGTNCLEDMFSQLGKWGILGGQFRGETYGECIESIRKLLVSWASGVKNAYSRGGSHSHEERQMVSDEVELGYAEAMTYNPKDFTDERLSELLHEGAKEALRELNTILRHDEEEPYSFDLDVSKIYFNSNVFCAEDSILQVLEQEDMGNAMPPADMFLQTNDDEVDEDEEAARNNADVYDMLGEMNVEESESEEEGGEVTAPTPSPPTESTDKRNPFILPSTTGAASLDAQKAVSLYNSTVNSNRDIHDRDTRIKAAALHAAEIKKNCSIIPMSEDEGRAALSDIVRPRDSISKISLLEYVAVVFTDNSKDSEGNPHVVKHWIGQLTGMTNRPVGGRAVKWERDVDIAAMPESLCCRARWFCAYLPRDNPEGYNLRNTPFYKYTPHEIISECNQEFKASTIIMSLKLEELDGFIKISNESMELLLSRLGDRKKDLTAPPTTRRKRTREESETAEPAETAPPLPLYTIPEEETLSHEDIKIDMEVDWRTGPTATTWDAGIVKEILDEGAYTDGMRYNVQSGVNNQVFLSSLDMMKRKTGKRKRIANTRRRDIG
jgi:hypothetical protein